MASVFKTFSLFLALVLLTLGGYLLFLSDEAPNFAIFGDTQTIAFILFLVSGILIAIWVVFQIISKSEN
jgi:membrane protease YdiL (CAAX protease family)